MFTFVHHVKMYVNNSHSPPFLSIKDSRLDILFYALFFFSRQSYLGLEKEMATHIPVFLPVESHGQRSLAGYSPWGRKSRTRLSD